MRRDSNVVKEESTHRIDLSACSLLSFKFHEVSFVSAEPERLYLFLLVFCLFLFFGAFGCRAAALV